MKLAAVVIWYNPHLLPNCLKNILSYSSLVSKVYIVDNSDCDNSAIANNISNVSYTPNLKNIGIAAAQNIGCQHALNDGFEWVMTMDQDSFFAEKQLKEYIKLCNDAYENDKNAQSFSLSLFDAAKDDIIPVSTMLKRKLKFFLTNYLGFKFNTNVGKAPVEHLQRVYASGNIIKLSMWKEIHGFDEALFIDEVDFDFCLRVVLNGYIITRFNTVFLNHTLGNRKRTLFPKCSYHSNFRFYYIIRNKLIEFKRYKDIITLQYDYKKEIFQYFKDYCIFDLKAPKHFITFCKAYIDYKKFIKNDTTYKELHKKL